MYQKIYNRLPQLLILGAFGPYLILNFGLRAEQVMCYCLFILFLPKLISLHRIKLDRVTFSIALIWVGIIVLSILASFAVSKTYAPTLKEFLAGMDNKLLPLCILLTVGAWQFNQINRQGINLLRDTLSKCALLLGFMLFINTLFGLMTGFDIAQIPFGFNVKDFLSHFWTSSLSTELSDSVAARALTAGRQTGIFNQPFEAGVMYSTGLLLYMYRYKIMKRINWYDILLLVFLIIGGLLSLSKVFVVLGTSLCFIYFLQTAKIQQLIVKCFMLCIVVISGFFLILHITSESWLGIDILKNWLMMSDKSNDSLMVLYSGGRFGTGLVSAFFSTIWNISPFIGVGFGNIGWPMDNGYFDMYKHGGIPALILYVILIVKLLHYSLKSSFIANFPEEASLLRFFVIFLIIAGLGAPVFTVNRVSTIIWLLIGLILPYVRLKAPRYAPRFNAIVRQESSA